MVARDRIAEFAAAALGCKLATFDVFDTLLHRVCSPETIILQTCRKIAGALYLDLQTVRNARDRAVASLRAEAFSQERGLDGEYRFEDLSSRMADELSRATGADPSLVSLEISLALASEIQMEYDCVYPDQRMVSIVHDLVGAGRKVAAVSDMYHSPDTILLLLGKIGLGTVFNRDNVFVSSDYTLTKASGRLYGVVLERYGLPPEEVVHIGDNQGSDVVAPALEGIRSFHHDASEHHDRYRLDFASQASGNDLGISTHEAACTVLDFRLLSNRIAAAVAPVLCQFSLEVAARSKALDVDSVWFMARDGYLPMRLYELFNDGSYPRARYLYVSRKSVAKASSNSYGIREAFMAQWNGESRKLAALLAPFDFSEEQAITVSKRFGFSSPQEEVDYATDPRFHRLMGDKECQKMFEIDSAKKKGQLLRYLDKSGFMSNRHVAVVDVGWAGQIQEALELAISDVVDRPKVTGLYMALRGLGGYRRLAGHDMEGLIYDCSRPDSRAASILNAVDVFEDTCRAHHGTVLGYDCEGQPILATATASRTAEIRDEPRLEDLQESIMMYAKQWITYVRMFSIPEEATRAAAIGTAARVTSFPTQEQALFFTSLGHSLDAGSDRLIKNVTEKGSGIIPDFGKIRSARWKEAAAAVSIWRWPLQLLISIKRRRESIGSPPPPMARSPGIRERN